MQGLVKQFFSYEYEKKVNKDLLFYSFDKAKVEEYVEGLINIPLLQFLEYVDNLEEKQQIEAKDIFQFSDFNDATIIFCEKMKNTDNPGMKFSEIGRLLLDDGKARNTGAIVKYGENHAKTAEMLGLAFELCKTYYLSGIGYIYAELSKEKQKKLLTRLVIRNKLILRMYQASKNGAIDMREFLYMISDTTYMRRRSNIKRILNVLSNSDEIDFKYFVDQIRW